MIDDQAFSKMEDVTEPTVEAGSQPGVDPAQPDPASPVIVIEYRRGLLSRLALPALILAAALAIFAYQRTRTLHQFATRPTVEPSVAKSSPPGPVPEKIIARAVNRAELAAKDAEQGDASLTRTAVEDRAEVVVSSDPPRPAPAPAPSEKKARSPFEIDSTDGMNRLDSSTSDAVADASQAPSAAKPAMSPTATPDPPDPALAGLADFGPPENATVSKEEILRDIQREADQVQADRNDREQLKPQARAKMLNESLTKIEADRVQFRKDLREVLKTYGNKAGPEIDRLCDQYGREIPEEVKDAYHRARRSFPQNLTRRGEIERMRMLGLPEPVLFDFLAHKIDKTKNSPNGPRDQFEVMVRAAQLLLTFPLATPSKATAGVAAKP